MLAGHPVTPDRGHPMTSLTLFGPAMTKPKSKAGRPIVVLDPNHIRIREVARVADACGVQDKKIVAAVGVSRMTLWRWKTGKLKAASA